MQDHASIVVVGGGIIGVSIANALTKAGVEDVLVLEKDSLASGSTGRSAGVIETQYFTDFDVAIRAYSLRAFERVADETRAEFPQVGYVRLLMDPDDEERFRESIRIQRRHGVDDARFLDPSEVATVVPDLNVEDVHGAIYGPSDGYADPYTMTQIFAERARTNGATVHTGVAAESVAVDDGEVRAVETSEGRVECETVVNAAGPWAPRLAAQTGLELPAAPYRRQVIVAEPPEEDAPDYTIPTVMEYVPGGSKAGVYFRGEGANQVLLGLHQEVGTDEEPSDPDRYSTDYDESVVLEISDLLDHRAPAFSDLSVVNGWSGLYTITPDTQPIIDTHPSIDGYVLAAGFSGKGFQIGPAVGEIVSDLVLDGETDLVPDLSPVSLSRFE
ncbi:NAD(P)/FAD-dependent oxidoreductase [Halorientalis halophila]|uniref:NAD(P)/FAD-dependent oxidoreductase n=1 Tax=Halorientalis halophila TaxID=3108499 RepID=UPI00300A893E